MKPGRELDMLIAEKVMGWVMDSFRGGVFTGYRYNGEFMRSADDFKPSAYIADAWKVVEKLHAANCQVNIELYEGENPLACFFRNRDEYGMVGTHCARGDTAPHAICLAALKAAGVDLENP